VAEAPAQAKSGSAQRESAVPQMPAAPLGAPPRAALSQDRPSPLAGSGSGPVPFAAERARPAADAEADAARRSAHQQPGAFAPLPGVAPSRLVAPQAGSAIPAADLHDLAAAGDWPAVALQLTTGVAVDLRDAQGRTLLMRAAAAGQRDMVRHLLAAGADPRLVDNDGRTAGQWAERAGRPDIAQLLGLAARAGEPGR
jgi:hypothetical protein